MQTFWLALLGLLLSGYFVLGGYDLGVQLLHPFMKDRDAALGRVSKGSLRACGVAVIDKRRGLR
ncbi:cytochrome d ubiquinol oxidase subunit II [Nonomuraea turcica]|uniref:cytochrome d ubiquinol oxidase subunit II n=1 Tax=Nonomuraea sp. G32 TaxID=3067274 RepID=UPI00273BEB66|nr:cytochrome d ubiquinol oxidase subunit II [Nonomuraea sp. G32]MDP4511460.1 cytochrome d ubiquinol oxidase subunit II [Nonomuraea sp. G32]